MGRLPRLSGRDVVRVFESLGWKKARQSGSHIILDRRHALMEHAYDEITEEGLDALHTVYGIE